MASLQSFIQDDVFHRCKHVIHDPTISNIINKVFPHIYIITLDEPCTVMRRAHTAHTLRKLGANFTFCYMRRPTKEIYAEYLAVYDSFSVAEHNSPPRWEPNYICTKLKQSELGVLSSQAWILANLENPAITIPLTNTTTSRQHMICEDDILSIKDFEERLTRFLGEYPTFPETSRLWMLASLDWKFVRRKITPTNGWYKPHNVDLGITGAGGYAVNMEYASELSMKMRTLKKCADQYFIYEFDAHREFQDGCVMSPPLLMTDFSTSTNDNTMDTQGLARLKQLCYPTIDMRMYNIMRFLYLENAECQQALRRAIARDSDLYTNLCEELAGSYIDFSDLIRDSTWSKADFQHLITNL